MNGINDVPLGEGQKLRIEVMQRAHGLGADDVIKRSARVRSACIFIEENAALEGRRGLGTRVRQELQIERR